MITPWTWKKGLLTSSDHAEGRLWHHIYGMMYRGQFHVDSSSIRVEIIRNSWNDKFGWRERRNFFKSPFVRKRKIGSLVDSVIDIQSIWGSVGSHHLLVETLGAFGSSFCSLVTLCSLILVKKWETKFSHHTRTRLSWHLTSSRKPRSSQ